MALPNGLVLAASVALPLDDHFPDVADDFLAIFTDEELAAEPFLVDYVTEQLARWGRWMLRGRAPALSFEAACIGATKLLERRGLSPNERTAKADAALARALAAIVIDAVEPLAAEQGGAVRDKAVGIVADEFMARATAPKLSGPAKRRVKKRRSEFRSGAPRDSKSSAEGSSPQKPLPVKPVASSLKTHERRPSNASISSSSSRDQLPQVPRPVRRYQQQLQQHQLQQHAPGTLSPISQQRIRRADQPSPNPYQPPQQMPPNEQSRHVRTNSQPNIPTSANRQGSLPMAARPNPAGYPQMMQTPPQMMMQNPHTQRQRIPTHPQYPQQPPTDPYGRGMPVPPQPPFYNPQPPFHGQFPPPMQYGPGMPMPFDPRFHPAGYGPPMSTEMGPNRPSQLNFRGGPVPNMAVPGGGMQSAGSTNYSEYSAGGSSNLDANLSVMPPRRPSDGDRRRPSLDSKMSPGSLERMQQQQYGRRRPSVPNAAHAAGGGPASSNPSVNSDLDRDYYGDQRPPIGTRKSSLDSIEGNNSAPSGNVGARQHGRGSSSGMHRSGSGGGGAGLSDLLTTVLAECEDYMGTLDGQKGKGNERRG